MRVAVFGVGYVGLVTGACLADLGNEVICVDVDSDRIDGLNRGELPIYEPGLESIVKTNVKIGRLSFSTDARMAVESCEIAIIAVGTPPNEDGSADMQYVLAVARTIGQCMHDFKVVVNKSTVPVGTGELVALELNAALQQRGFPFDSVKRAAMNGPTFSIVSNPEFLKEGAAIEDFMRPDRIVLGTHDDGDGHKALAKMKLLYAPFNRHHERVLCMDVRSAEFTKYASNAMLATRISFMNELANLADKVGVDIERVRKGMGSDPRIGFGFLYAGAGYGGSCFPKDVQALLRTASTNGQALQILQAVEDVNQKQKQILFRNIHAHFGGDLHGKTFAVWGLSFKPNTDDMREAPSRVLLKLLVESGARVRAHDPIAMSEAERVLEQDFGASSNWRRSVEFVERPLDAVRSADALIIVTEWKAYQSPDFAEIKALLRSPVIFDGRNLFEPQLVAEAGLSYFGIGRRSVV